jgi:CMP-N,N'-diacetyllegionaminic acid synthase
MNLNRRKKNGYPTSMQEAPRILGVIPARGGSKGLGRKNIRLVGGRPMISWTIEAAHSSKLLDRTILSSDDREIIEISKGYGCDVPFIRDSSLAGDNARTIDVVVDALKRCEGYDWVVVLQPTSPLRSSNDIDNAINLCFESGAQSCVSVVRVQESPYWMFSVDQQFHMSPLLPETEASRRQDLPRAYLLNGAIYVANVKWLLNEMKFIAPDTVAYEMPFERSLDIDTDFDLKQLNYILGDF